MRSQAYHLHGGWERISISELTGSVNLETWYRLKMKRFKKQLLT